MVKIIRKTLKEDHDALFKEKFIAITVSLLLWIFSIIFVDLFNLSQYTEHILTNLGFLIMSIVFFHTTIIESRKEYQELQNINELLTQKVQERTKELEYAIEQKTNTFISLAHEIRTPLTLVNNYLGEEIDIIKDNIEILNSDVNTFFNEEKFRKGLSPHNHNQIINFSKLLSDKIVAFKSYALKKKIILTGHIDANINIKADPDALHSIVNNLIENAVKFTTENGSIEVSLKVNNSLIQFSVKDSGCGIPPDMQGKIFDPYFQINRENLNYQGIGIGLSIVNNFVKSLDGQILLKSKENEGSEFIIELTQYHLSENDNVVDHKLFIPSKFNVFEKGLDDVVSSDKKESILIVEDNYNMLRFLRNNLSDRYNVFLAENGKKALLKLKTIPPPNLFISDVMMGEMDGFKFLKAISDEPDYKHIPCIFLTAKTTDRDRLQGLSLGAVDYISKPFPIAELIKKAESIISNARKQKEVILNSALEYLTKQKELPKKDIDTQKDVFDSNCKIYSITQREKEIIQFIVDGFTYKEIGAKLFLAERTVQKHCENIFNKVEVNSKFELIKKLQAK
jgi:signal transduction histidine kinase/DNA-binding NarL/FixJ family response regulator